MKINRHDTELTLAEERCTNQKKIANGCLGQITNLTFRCKIMNETVRIAVERQEKAELDYL